MTESVKMYKRQFDKWGWRKYRSNKHLGTHRAQSGTQRSCYRRPEHRQRIKEMLHESTPTALVNKALSRLRDFVETSIAMDDQWRAASKFEPLLENDDLEQYLLQAHASFQRSDPVAGGMYLRAAFFRISDRVGKFGVRNVTSWFATIVSTLDNFFTEDLVRIYLSYIADLLER